jgi:general secretion pathway protein I
MSLGRPNSNRQGSNTQGGFTLLEILVALVVVALGLTAAVKLTTQSAHTVAYLRDKSYAHWVAMNVIAEYRLKEPWSEPGERKGSSPMGRVEWPWTAAVETTEDESVRKLTVTVEREKMKLALVAYIARATKGEPKAQ